MSQITGIFASDVVIRTALLEGINDLRRYPYLLDFVFAFLPKDALTAKMYGLKEQAQARKWFQRSNIPIFLSTRLDKPKFPCISIGLLESIESENTLADVHYNPKEDGTLDWPALTDPFCPTGFTSSTGVMKLPDAVTSQLVLAPGMMLIDDIGGVHEILDVTDQSTIVLAAGTTASFTQAIIKGAPPSAIVAIESCRAKESYSIGCHVQGEDVWLTYLHAIVQFILFRYRETLLEARGFERSSINSSDFRRNDAFSEVENIFSRHINVTGYVQQMWPKLISPKITGVASVPVATGTGQTVDAVVPEIGVDQTDAWLVDSDGLGVKA